MTVVSDGSKLVMFVPPAAHSHEAPRVREASRPLSGHVKERVVTAGAAPVGVTCLALTIYSASTAFQRDPLGQVVTATICQACQPIKHLNGRAFITPTFRSE